MAHFDLEAVMKKVDELLALELHITESETRKDAWDHLERTGSIYRTVNTLGNEYESLYNVEVKKKNSSYAKFTVDYFLQLGKSFTSTEIYIDQQFSLADRNAIYNFLGHCVFVYGQSIDKGFSASTDTNASISSYVAPETERGLLSLGGGCMGEIWKVDKGRKQNASLSVKQRQQAQNLYDMTFQLKMTFEEKKDDSVPIGLRIRDHGGLFIPKTAFLPFLKETINLVMKYANEASYRRYGKGMLKFCMAEVKNTVALWNAFNQACEVVIPGTHELNRKVYFEEWLCKLAHARLAEFISAQTQMRAEKAGKRSNGGQTLRDQLFALTEKTRSKSTAKRAKGVQAKQNISKGKQPLKKTSQLKRIPEKIKQTASRSMTTEIDPTASTSSMADPVPPSELHRPKRIRVKSKLLFDFVE